MSNGLKKLLVDGGVNDIFCRLPRDLLDKIIEHLPVNDAARTSILSRKWRFIWAAYPYLKFDRQFFENITASKPNSANRYVNVINKVLFGHDGPVLRFHLHIPNLLCDMDEHIDEWLLFLSRNGIQDLILNYLCPTPYKLPSYVFSSPKLKNLILFNVIFKPPVTLSGFANLVRLYFKNVTFVASAFNGVSPVAPLVKILAFLSCTGINYFSISAPQASFISVNCSSEARPNFFDKFPNLSIILIFVGWSLKGTPMNLCELHEKFPRVKTLGFDGCYLKLSAPTLFKRRLSFVFECLKVLDLLKLVLDDLDQLSCALTLLNSSPNLENFDAWVSSSKGSSVESVLTHLKSPNCMDNMLNLRTVRLRLLGEGSKPELVFIKCILAHSPNLEFLHINYSVADEDEQHRISNEVVQFPCASNSAKVVYESV